MFGYKKIILLFFSLILFVAAILKSAPVETNLTSAFLDPSSKIIKLANLSSKRMNIIFEADNQDILQEVKSEFAYNISKEDLLGIYKNYPANFLTDNARNLIKTSNYEVLKTQSLERLYNPFGVYVAPPDQDPYLFATDYVLNCINKMDNIDKLYNGKYYSVINVKINNEEDIEKYLSLKTQRQDVNIYFTGAPIHSYFATKKSVIEINIICLISACVFIFLCRFCFKSYKIIIPIVSSILFGFMMGYSFSALIFQKLHILTFVFSTSLIGISLDYSLHYFLTGEEENFKRNLTASMITTITSFLIIGLSGIDVLKQIAVFTGFGLIGVYLFVVIILDSKFDHVSFKLPSVKLKADYLVLVFVLVIFGLTKLSFNDNIQNLYKPPSDLVKSERLFENVFENSSKEFILIDGKNLNEILKKEEDLHLDNYLGLSSFISSLEKQQENYNLVQELYHKNLDSYAGFISEKKRQELKNTDFKPYDVEKYSLKQEFLLDNNTSFVVVPKHVKNSISPASEISKHLKIIREQFLKLFPLVFFALFCILTMFYGLKNSLRILSSPLIGIIVSVALLSLGGSELNLFNILALFLVIGFSIDYSIFRLNSTKKSELAVLISVISTAFSFMLLSFTGFKLISSLSMTLFLGILASYLSSLFVIKSRNESNS